MATIDRDGLVIEFIALLITATSLISNFVIH
jgi:hypothetical protein